MTTIHPWVATGALPPDGTITVLEASAGTGKTYQIGGIATRLVAQEGVPVDKLLIITFTSAATAELRDRVRRRLSQARDALTVGGKPPGNDDVIATLCGADPVTRELYLARLQAALTSYDRAPISTIHGFCQRTLDTLAFESGQETGLEVLGEAAALRDEVVADELANLYAGADAEELAALESAGFTRDNLALLVRMMTGPVEPEVEPMVEGAAGPLAAVARWRREAEALREWLGSPEAAAARAAFRVASSNKLFKRLVSTAWDEVDGWLTGLAAALAEGCSGAVDTLAKRPSWLTTGRLEPNCSRPNELVSFPGLEIVRRLDAACDARAALCCGTLAGFAKGVRARFERELERRGVLTYDAMLSRLAERLDAEERAAIGTGAPRPLTEGLRAKFDAVLVDEFQDTDEAQWTVLRRAFGEPGANKRLFLIGDPKQAIYRFRGADLHVYAAAVGVAGDAHRHDLDTNHRSDPALVGALNHLWIPGPTASCRPFGGGAIAYVPVKAANTSERLVDPTTAAGALDLRWFDAATEGRDLGRPLNKTAACSLAARLGAAECLRLLGAGVRLREGDTTRPVHPGDLAVLVNSHRQGEQMRSALAAVGIPAVAGGRSSVLHSDALGWLRAWLDAVAAPANERPARLLAVTPLFGWTAADLANGLAETPEGGVGPLGEPGSKTPVDWAALRGDINRWAVAWTTRGFARVFHDAAQTYGVYARLLGSLAGERGATDLRHLSEVCHAEERRSRLGPGALSEWLRRQAAEAEESEEEALRLESDAQAVRIVTVHASKGLQYPITLLPFAWDARKFRDTTRPLASHAETSGRPIVDLHAKKTPRRDRVVAQERREVEEEAWRLAYVAMTRAEHRCVAWLGAVAGVCAPLTMLAAGRTGEAVPTFKRASGGVDKVAETEAANRGATDRMLSALTGLASAPGIRFVREAPLASTARYAPAGAAAPATPVPAAWPGERRLGAHWLVASYSGLSGALHVDLDEPVRAPPIEGERVEEGVVAGSDAPDGVGPDAPLPAVPVAPELAREACGAGLPGGTTTGTWLHAVLEELDFGTACARNGDPLDVLVARARRRHGGDASADAEIVRLAPGWLSTPLDGPPTGLPTGFSLRDLPLADRLDELAFDLRLGDGVRWTPSRRAHPGDYTGRIDPRSVRLALQAALPTGGDEPPGYAAWLRTILDRPADDGGDEPFARILPAIAGLLTGSIDLVFRAADPAGGTRYFVSDYKSNRIVGPSDGDGAPDGDGPRRSRRSDYTLPMLRWEMGRKAYHLQALLYTLALHRMLTQRLGARYDYDAHVGGHLYLFLKGMEGPDTPRHRGLALGVYADRWPARTVHALDAALDGTGPDVVARILAGGTR